MRIGLNGRHLGPNKTGVGRYLLNILNEWNRARSGHEFFIYYSSEELQPEDRAATSTMHLRQIPRPFGTNSFHLWYNFSLPRAVAKDKVDFFFSPDYFLPPLLKGIKKSMTIHDVSYLAHPEWFPPLYRLYGQFYSKRPAASSDIVFTVSKFSKNELVRCIPKLHPQRIVVTAEAADDRFKPSAQPRPNLSLYGLTGPYFLSVGKIFNRRHVAESLYAFERYLDSTADRTTQFALRGKNETHPFIGIEALVKEINSKAGREAVVFLPYMSDVELITLYQHAAGFFYLSTYEGFGLPVLESLACGTPTITVKATSIPEVAGEAAVYVDPKDISALQEIMRRLIQDEDWVTALRQPAIDQAKQFTWLQTATQTLSAIEHAYGK